MMRFVAPLGNYVFDDNSLTIIFFKDGVGELRWKHKNVKIGENRFIVINPSIGWEYVNEKEEYIDVLSLIISDTFRKQLNFYNNATVKQLLDTPFDQIDESSFFMESPLNADYFPSGKLLKSIHQQSTNEEFKLFSPEELSIEVLQRISQEQINAYNHASRIVAKKKSTQIEIYRRLLIVYEYIHDNIANPISFQELSLESSLSKYHLYESFKAVYGKTPHQYINWLKVTKAKEHLQKGLFSISEVADLLGYSDLSVFSKVFKKVYGKSPSYYQK
ncbi:helix-turn-helix transcriptional regulator [Flagellimonas sp. 389]|uniref:helix-turn-helix domain-containing protein n=1 Tax=Flagellimonas sp. 389 TaxID=2835862 RepID=UPI001BD6D8ED|nr:helix-turn-helix domain-containing protein [Flagellimonas sp. 389]MBS9463385.1 helix-turn-helix transcriptional regulator [Flagellimonas sp. 389]